MKIQDQIDNDDESSAKRLMIQGHRGGFKPDNTLKGYQLAIDNKLDAIEVDVWLTKDCVPILLHGGDNGEVHEIPRPDAYVFEYTYEELLQIKVEGDQKIPSLEEMLTFIDKKLFINIEVKTPYKEEIWQRYNYLEAVKKVYESIKTFQYQSSCCISSFDRRVIMEFQRLVKTDTDFGALEIIHLYNFYDHHELPDHSDFIGIGTGINISATKLTQEVVRACHSNGMKVGVWIDSTVFKENTSFYLKILKLGVDFLVTDYPIAVSIIRDMWLKNKTLLIEHINTMNENVEDQEFLLMNFSPSNQRRSGDFQDLADVDLSLNQANDTQVITEINQQFVELVEANNNQEPKIIDNITNQESEQQDGDTFLKKRGSVRV